MVKLEPSLRESPSATDTINRILDAAEELFADHGIAGTSVRDITQMAKVNVAAVNYHFETKDKLVYRVLARRAADLEHERTKALDRVEERAANESRPPAVTELVDAMIGPIVDLALSETGGWHHFIRFVSRLSWEPGFENMKAPESQIRIFERFDKLLQRALPALTGDPSTRLWRIVFMRSATQQTLMLITSLKAGKYPEGIPFLDAAAATPVDTIKREFTAFIAAGLAAPNP
jgi:AcrR family transcriptional regulator